jgi:hypothetical protein
MKPVLKYNHDVDFVRFKGRYFASWNANRRRPAREAAIGNRAGVAADSPPPSADSLPHLETPSAQLIQRAIPNAAAEAAPPIAVVCSAPRNGVIPVILPLTYPKTNSAASVTATETPSAVCRLCSSI